MNRRERVAEIVRDIISDYTEFGHVDDAEVRPYARRILALLQPKEPEGERIEGWIDYDEAPDDGFFVGFWKIGDDIPFGCQPIRRATLILKPKEGDGE